MTRIHYKKQHKISAEQTPPSGTKTDHKHNNIADNDTSIPQTAYPMATMTQ
jgi:hypothetical protein